MHLTILTPTGNATIKNSQSKAGYKALIAYLTRMQVEKTPFVVLPAGTIASDLYDAIDNDNVLATL